MDFRRVDIEMLPELLPFIERQGASSCDFTVGGIMLWAKMFDYEACLEHDTLYIRGRAEGHPERRAYSVPIGGEWLTAGVNRLKDYCAMRGEELMLSAVPEEAIATLIEAGAQVVEPLPDWSDYIYDAHALATLEGKKMAKKRNHVHRFMADNPEAILRRATMADTTAMQAFAERMMSAEEECDAMGLYDRQMTLFAIAHMAALAAAGMEWYLLEVPEHGIVAMTAGEVRGETLHVHIEKMNHEVSGAGETVCSMFVREMLRLHPEVKEVNRQDDAGEEGLRRGKLSWHPVRLLKKYNVQF